MTTQQPLYQGISKCTGETIQGVLFINRVTNEQFILPNEKAYVRIHNWQSYEIEKDSYGEFFGKYDCKGKELFTNDLVEIELIDTKMHKKKHNGVIKYSSIYGVYYIYVYDLKTPILFAGNKDYKVVAIHKERECLY